MWKDLFIEDIWKMPVMNLVTHCIPTYLNAIPKVAKPVLYSIEEVKWQKKNISDLVMAGVIVEANSP